MHVNVAKEVAVLRAMSVGELRVRYAEVFGEPARTGHKVWLIKRIVWRLQALAEGGLSERARRRAAESRQRCRPAPVPASVCPGRFVKPSYQRPTTG
jgi:Protein of unknown function (DUF2924)